MSITSNPIPEEDKKTADNIKFNDDHTSKSNTKRNSIHADSTNDHSFATR